MIYADYNGSAPLSKAVKDYLIKRFDTGPFANPNAIHYLGQKTMMGLENARRVCARKLGATPHQIIFNSGATEGINTVFHGLLEGQEDPRQYTIVISGIEHSAVVNTAKHYQQKGFHLEVLPTLPNGIVDLSPLPNILSKHKVKLVAVMAANNETGVIQPFEQCMQICRTHGVPYFCDTTQLIGKAPFNFASSGIDYGVMSGHKMGALTGTGILLAKEPATLRPLILGGGQERSLRGGTQHYLGLETLAVALDDFDRHLPRLQDLEQKRRAFEAAVKEAFPQVVIMGEDAPRLASTTFISLPGLHGQAVQIELESQDIFVTTSSACSDNEPVTSKVLKSMGVDDQVGRGVVRISLGCCSPLEWYDQILTALVNAYEKLTRIKSY